MVRKTIFLTFFNLLSFLFFSKKEGEFLGDILLLIAKSFSFYVALIQVD